MSITRDTTGLVVEDDFDRASSTTLGGDWNERAGDWAVSENFLAITAGGGAYHVDNDAETIGAMFVQASMRVSHEDSSAAIWARFAYGGGSDSGYLLFIVPNSDVIRIQNRDAGSWGANVDESKTLTTGISYPSQLYVANAVQEGWVDGTTVSATQTVHDDENTRVAGFRAGHAGGGRTTQIDDFIWCRSKNIVVTGLPSGYKAKVRNSGGSVVAEATESGGTATIDASRFGGATEIVPIGGWTDLIVTDSGDTIQETYNSTTVYPGDEYTFSQVVTGAGTLVYGGFEMEGAGASTIEGTGLILIPRFEMEGAALGSVGTGLLILPEFRMEGAGVSAITGQGALILPEFRMAGAGASGIEGTGLILIPEFRMAGAAAEDLTGTGLLLIPRFLMSGTGYTEAPTGVALTINGLAIPVIPLTGWQSEGMARFAARYLPGNRYRSAHSTTRSRVWRWQVTTPFRPLAEIATYEAAVRTPGRHAVSGYLPETDTGRSLLFCYHRRLRKVRSPQNPMSYAQLSFTLEEADPVEPT